MESKTVRHRAALGGLVLGTVLLTIDDLVKPEGGDGAEGMAESVAGAPDAWLIGWTLTLLGAAVVLPGIGAISRLVDRRGSGLTAAGILLMGGGLVGTAALAASNLLLVPVVGDDAAAAVPTIERLNESPALLVVFLLYLPGRFLGLPLLIGGLVRAGIAPRWTLLAAIASVLVGFVASGVVPEADAISSVLMLLAFGGLVTARRPDSRPTAAHAAHAVQS
jgi:hypothetical protein